VSRHHLLNGLPGDSELTRDVGLGEPLREQFVDHCTPLDREFAGDPDVFDCSGSDLDEAVEGSALRWRDLHHVYRVTTRVVSVNRWLSQLGGGSLEC